MKIDFPADSYEVAGLPGKYYKVLVTPDTMTIGKEALYDYVRLCERLGLQCPGLLDADRHLSFACMYAIVGRHFVAGRAFLQEAERCLGCGKII